MKKFAMMTCDIIWIGTTSYSLYIWRIIAIVMIQYIFSDVHKHVIHIFFVTIFIFLVVPCLLCFVSIYYYFLFLLFIPFTNICGYICIIIMTFHVFQCCLFVVICDVFWYKKNVDIFKTFIFNQKNYGPGYFWGESL